MNELDFLQQLLRSQQDGTSFLGSTTQYRTPFDVNTIMPSVQAAMTGITGVGAGASKAATDVASTVPDAVSGFSKALPFIGLGLTAASTVMSFVEAGKAADAQRSAEKAAEAALVEQKRLQQQDFYEALRVPTEVYDRQFREGTAANAQAIEALSQDPRMLLGGVQGVQEATIEGQAKNREAMADRLFSLDAMKAQADTQQADDLSKIAADEAQGAQIAAMAAEKAKIAQQQAAMQGVGGLITQGAGMVGTYGKLATPGDYLSSLSSSVNNSAFGNKQPSSNQMMQYLMQNPDMLQRAMQMMQKT
jgi:hypothetical protein